MLDDPTPFSTLGQVRRAHDGHWFDRDTMRFFGCRVPADYTPLISGRYFVSSEKQDYDAPRLYTIREVRSDASIDTVGEFQGYASKAAAERAARKLPHEYGQALMDVLTSDLHNRTDWIRRASQLASYTGAPLVNCREVIAARAKQRRHDRIKQAA